MLLKTKYNMKRDKKVTMEKNGQQYVVKLLNKADKSWRQTAKKVSNTLKNANQAWNEMSLRMKK